MFDMVIGRAAARAEEEPARRDHRVPSCDRRRHVWRGMTCGISLASVSTQTPCVTCVTRSQSLQVDIVSPPWSEGRDAEKRSGSGPSKALMTGRDPPLDRLTEARRPSVHQATLVPPVLSMNGKLSCSSRIAPDVSWRTPSSSLAVP